MRARNDLPELVALVDVLRRRRRDLGWTQRDVAERIGSTQATLARWERLAVDPPAGEVCRWASVLGLTLVPAWTHPTRTAA